MKTFVNKTSQEPVGKRHPHPLIRVLVLGLVALLCASSQPATAQLPDATQDYTIQVIEPPEGPVAVWCTFVNESGLVAMQYGLPDDPPFFGHTAIMENGQWRNIDVPGSVATGVAAPNAAGQVPLDYVCEEQADVFRYHVAIYNRGEYKPIPDHDFYQFILQCWNEHGNLVGVAFDPADYIYHGVRFNASLSLFELFDPPGSTYTLPFGMNNAGLIVGWYERVDANPGFLYDGHTFTDIVVPGATFTGVTSINDRKTIGGFYSAGNDGSWHGFILEKGELKDFTIPGQLIAGQLYWMTLDCITDNGRISGEYGDEDGDHAFIATPKPGRK